MLFEAGRVVFAGLVVVFAGRLLFDGLETLAGLEVLAGLDVFDGRETLASDFLDDADGRFVLLLTVVVLLV